MKCFIKAVCAAFVLTVIYSMIPFQAACGELSGDVLRLHILANSDSAEDQALKLRVRDRILKCSQSLFEQAQSKEEAAALAAAELHTLADAASAEIADNGYSYRVRAELVRMPFDTRHYEDYTLPSGTYDALRITIGEGKGHNWWCVMFPSICVSSSCAEGESRARESLSDGEYELIKNEKQEYKFFIIELFEKIRRSFG